MAIAAALPLICAYPVFRVLNVLQVEIGTQRALGTWALMATPVLVLATLVLAVLTWNVQPGPRLRHVIRSGLFTVAIANGVLVGGAIFYHHFRLSPTWLQVLALVVMVVASIRYAMQAEAHQAPVQRLLYGLGLAVYGIPLLAAPWVAHGAWTDAAQDGAPVPTMAGAWARTTAPKRVVLVIADMLRYRTTSMYGKGDFTPNLAKLAAESTSFSRAYSPTDATLISVPVALTGRRADQIAKLPLSTSTAFFREGSLIGLAAYLRHSGFRAYYSEMLVTPRMFGMERDYDDGFATAYGFPNDDNRLNARSYLPIGQVLEWMSGRMSGGQDRPPAAPGSLAETLKHAAEFFERPDERLFLRVHLGPPHEPFYPITKDPKTGELIAHGEGRVEYEQVVEQGAAKAEKLYEDNTRFMDQELGRFLKRVMASPHWQDTLFIFSADHGAEFRPGLTSHGTGEMSELQINIPLVIHHPGQKGPTKDIRLASLLDVAPTILSAVYEKPPVMPGRDLLAKEDPDHIVSSWGLYAPYSGVKGFYRAISAHQGTYKYLLQYPGHLESLYDLSSDPDCHRDVAASQQAITARLRDWVEQTYQPPSK